MMRGRFNCPVCGEEVPPNAKACPECGACDKSGWSGQRYEDGLNLPDAEEDFDYDKFLEEEFGRSQRRTGLPWLWVIVAALVLLAFLALSLRTFLFAR